jgi:23S rRNA (uracil1939-C5)-methyltransferase
VTCRHFGVCGGCSLPGVAYDEQIRRKQAQLRTWFGADRLLPFEPSPAIEHFRHKVAFVFGRDREGRLTLGHYEAASRRIVAVQECPVHAEPGNRLAFALRDHLSRGRVPPALLRHVLIRTTDAGDEAAVMLVVTENHRALRTPVRAFLAGEPRPTGFFINIHDRPGPYMVGPTTMRIDGRSHVRERVGGTTFLISPTAFFQTNVGAASVLSRLVLDHVGPARRVLDLYSGTGLFAVPLAKKGAQVVAVEENRQAVADAGINLRANKVDERRARLVVGRVEDVLPRFERHTFDATILDPPRQGCPDAVIDAVCGTLRPRLAVYVSCNPERLAVERPRIERHGYRLDSVRGIDMFPHTEHVEAVAVFRCQRGEGTMRDAMQEERKKRDGRMRGVER